jgi:hypothetical protein
MKGVFDKCNMLINNDIVLLSEINIYMGAETHCFYSFCVVVLFEEDILNYCYYEKKSLISIIIYFIFYKCECYVFIC